jgi:hypothetical protein
MKAITLNNIWNYYKNDKNEDYWYATDEPAKYVIYTIDYGTRFIVSPIGSRTWRISIPSGAIPKLYVNLKSYAGDTRELASYPANYISFEIVVSLDPIGSSYQTNMSGQAPKKITSISATWGEIKSR